MEKIPMTRAGYDVLDEELRNLKSVERPAVIKAIAEAREHMAICPKTRNITPRGSARASSRAGSRNLESILSGPR